MKTDLLLVGAYLLVWTFPTVLCGDLKTDMILGKCGITKENDTLLYDCLVNTYKTFKQDNPDFPSKSVKGFILMKKLEREATKCFTDKDEAEKCFKKMKEGYKKPKGFRYDARALYYGSKKTSSLLYNICGLNEGDSPTLFKCLEDFEPKAFEIIKDEDKDQRGAFELMAKLLSNTSICYAKITADQGKCLFDSMVQLKKNITIQMKESAKKVSEKLLKCGIKQDVIDKVRSCVEPKTKEFLDLSFEMYKKPEVAGRVYDLAEEAKQCVMKYPKIVKCLMPEKMGGKKPEGPFKPGPKRWKPRGSGDSGRRGKPEISVDMILGKCGITKENDTLLYDCLVNTYKTFKQDNPDFPSKSVKGIILMKKLQKEAAKCFTDKEEAEKCFQTLKGGFQGGFKKPKEFKYDARALFYGSKMGSRVMFKMCGLNEGDSPFLFECLEDFEPKAFEIMKDEDKDQRGAFVLMAELLSNTSTCYRKITIDQEKCILDTMAQFKKNMTTKMKKYEQIANDKLLKCGVKQGVIDEVKSCVEPKATEFIDLSFEMYKKPEVAGRVFDLAEEQMQCIKKYPDVIKCMMPDKMGDVKPGSPFRRGFKQKPDEAKKTTEPPKKADTKKMPQRDQSWKKTDYSKKIDPKEMLKRMDMMLNECGIKKDKTPELYLCLNEINKVVMEIKPWIPMTDEARARLRKQGAKYMQCFGDKHDKEKKCIDDIGNYYRSKQTCKYMEQFFSDPKGLMDKLMPKCDITDTETPILKACLVRHTAVIMKLKPWIPMDENTREKLKKASDKYSDCFQESQDANKKNQFCMKKVIDGFKQMGKCKSMKKFDMGSKMTECGISDQKTPDLKKCLDEFNKKREERTEEEGDYWKCFGDKYENEKQCMENKDGHKFSETVNMIKSRVLLCSKNKHFQEKTNEAAKIGEKYLKNPSSKLLAEFRSMCIKALDSLSEEPTEEKNAAFKCLAAIQKTLKKGSSQFMTRQKRDVEEDTPDQFPALFVGLEIDDDNGESQTTVNIFQILFNAKNINQMQALVETMKKFISTCTAWPLPDDNTAEGRIIDHGALRRPIIDHGGLPARGMSTSPPPPPLLPPSDYFQKDDILPALDDNFNKCKKMYDGIRSFINTGEGDLEPVREVEKDDHDGRHGPSTAVIIAAAVGTVIVGILLILTAAVLFVTRRGCNKRRCSPSPPNSTVPVEVPPSNYTNFPTKQILEKEQPPVYSEVCPPPGNVYSQILSSSQGETTEKSC